MSPRASKPTLVSLARELGVSRQTVSNVINAPQLVRPETRARVQAAIERSGYRPSALGRALRTQRSMNLAFRISPSTDDSAGLMLDHFLHALAEAAQARGYRITLLTAPDHAGELLELKELRSVHAIDGCILTSPADDDDRPARLASVGCPFVVLGRPWGALPGTHAWVDIDQSTVMVDAIDELRRRGHRRIGFLGWAPGIGCGDERRQGWRQALKAARLASDLETDTTAAALATQAAQRLKDEGATALVCASDTLALSTYALFVDDDPFVPVVGFDDTPLCKALGLSSVAQPMSEAAEFCIDALVAQLTTKDTDPAAYQRLLPAHFVVRERSGALV